MSAEQLYHISYSGIEAVSAARANELSVNERSVQNEMTSIQNAQLNRLGDRAESVIAPTITAGLIVRCPSNEVHDIYDAVFGGTSSQPKSANIISFPQSSQQTALQSLFAQSAARFHMVSDFSTAAKTVRGNNENFTLERAPEERAFKAA